VITGIDLDIGNILTFGIGLMSVKNKYQINWVLTKFHSLIAPLTACKLKTIVTDLDKTLIKVAIDVFENT
jgi:predicted HAD superfamily phosphohydrolase YqeG